MPARKIILFINTYIWYTCLHCSEEVTLKVASKGQLIFFYQMGFGDVHRWYGVGSWECCVTHHPVQNRFALEAEKENTELKKRKVI